MKALLSLPRWLAGAFLLFCAVPAMADPAVAYNCSTVNYFLSHGYTQDELRAAALAHGYTKADIAKAEACIPPKEAPKPAPLEHGKRSPTLPPVHTLPPPKAPAAVTPVVVQPSIPAPTPAPVVVQPSIPAPTPAPVPEARKAPEKASWAWDFLEYLAGILIVGSALGIIVNKTREYLANRKVTA